MSALLDSLLDTTRRAECAANDEPALAFRVDPGPVETTFAQGRAAYPRELHDRATIAAQAGWLHAQDRERFGMQLPVTNHCPGHWR
jgi:hypothetical protein